MRSSCPGNRPPDRVVGVVRARPRRQGSGPAGRLGQELALAPGRRPALADPALDGRRGRAAGLAGRRVVGLPRASSRRLERAQIAGKAAADRLENQEIFLTVPASFDPVARELTIEAATQGRSQECHAARGAAGRLLRLARLPGREVAQEGQGRRHHPGLRRRRRHDRLHVDRRQAMKRATSCSRAWPSASTSFWAATTWTSRWPMPSPARCPRAWKASTPPSASRCSTPAAAPRKRSSPSPRRTRPPVTVLGRGSKVVGGSIKTELTREMLKTVLIDGFLPRVRPDRSARAGPAHRADGDRSSLRRGSRDHAPPGAVPRSAGRLAAFGRAARAAVGGALQRRRVQGRPSCAGESSTCFRAGPGEPVPELESSDLDLAVAHGAAYYGQVRRGKGVRIRGGVSRSYYVGLETAAPAVPGVPPPIKALCVVPMGMEEGTETDVPGPEIGLIVGEPAQFRFLGSTVRRDDPPGTILDRWSRRRARRSSLRWKPPSKPTTCSAGEPVPVRLHSRVTEVGTLELSCQSTRDQRRWKLEFNVREPARRAELDRTGRESGDES